MVELGAKGSKRSFRFLCEMYHSDNIRLIGPEQFALLACDSKACHRFWEHNDNIQKFLVPIHEKDSKTGNLDWALLLVDAQERRCILFGAEDSIHWSQLNFVHQMFSSYGALHIECIPFEHMRDRQASFHGSMKTPSALHDGITMLVCAYRIVTGATTDQSCMQITKDKLKDLIHNFEFE